MPNDNPSAVPLYYRFAIRVAKPLYRLKIWREHRKNNGKTQPDARFNNQHDTQSDHTAYEGQYKTLSNNPTKLATFERQTRFGEQYPPRPYPTDAQHSLIWCHAVSLGETNTIAPMLDNLLNDGHAIWLTNTTHTGFARGQERFADAINREQLAHSFVPVDDDTVITKFLDHVRPNLALFVETELWANTLAQLKQRNIPSVLVNARLSQKSFANYQRFGKLAQSMMHNLTLIIAQDDESAKRFRQLGADASQIRLTDSLKWSSVSVDDEPSLLGTEQVKNQISQTDEQIKQPIRPIWVAGSTHEGEDKIILDAHQQVLKVSPDAILILVPRHPERFDSVAELVANTGLKFERRSAFDKADMFSLNELDEQTQVLLADSMGELMRWYAVADVALVGGSLVDGIGGHNPIEPASLAKPILMGEYTASCDELVQALSEVGALQVVRSKPNSNSTSLTEVLADKVVNWLTHSEDAKRAGQAGKSLVQAKSGAMQTQLEMVLAVL